MNQLLRLRGLRSSKLLEWMEQGAEILAEHPVNIRREEAGKKPATNIWLWGLGWRPKMELFSKKFNVSAAMVAAVDLLRGLGRILGYEVIDVPTATGYLDTDFAAKGQATIEALKDHDLVVVHIEAPDEAGHLGDTQEKIKALESIDRDIVGPVHESLKQLGDYRILVTPDHHTFVRTKTHARGNVPWVLCGTGVEADSAKDYCEETAAKSSLCFEEGSQLMPFFLKK